MENPLLLMAEIAEKFSFSFPSVNSIVHARNKYLMKRCFIEHGIPCAYGILVEPNAEIDEKILYGFTFPLIIKPVDSFSSRGVFLVTSFDELQQYLDKTKSFSSDGKILIEEFLNGPEVSVESVTYNGQTTVIQITDKVITNYPYTVEMAHIQPSSAAQTTPKSHISASYS